LKKCMYNSDYNDHEMNTDPYYNLIKLDDDLWKNLIIKDNLKNNNLLFNSKKIRLIKNGIKSVKNTLSCVGWIYKLFDLSYIDILSELGNKFETKSVDEV